MNINILLVDDIPQNLLALEAVLSSSKYNLIKALSGEEALKHVLREEFAVILLDVQMPGLDGFETARLIKEREKSQQIPIIFISALSQASEHLNRGYAAGGIDFIFKPFNPEALKIKIEGFVELYEYRKQIEASNQRLQKLTLDLHKAERLARIISDISTDTIVTSDSRGRIISVNPAVRGMFGYTEEELLGEPYSILLPKAGLNQRGQLVETSGRRRDTSEFEAEIQIGETNYENEHIFVISIRDISERKQQFIKLESLVEERTLELKQSNQRTRDILKSIRDGFFVFDKDWRFSYVNEEAELLMSKTREEIMGKTLEDAYPELLNSIYTEKKKQVAFEEKAINFEALNIQGTRWFQFHVYPYGDGYTVHFSDITERKKNEKELLLSQERFAKIFDASPDMVSIRNQKDLRFIDVNKSWLAFLGYAKEEVIGRTASELGVVKEQSSLRAVEGASKKRNLHNKEVTYYTRSGQERLGLVSTQLIELNGEICVLTVIKDISELKRMEREIYRLDRLNLIGEMAAGIGHEIRNPLTSVRGLIQLLERKNEWDQYKSYFRIMIEELDRANFIISEFLSLAKDKPVETEPHNLSHIVKILLPLISADALRAEKYIVAQTDEVPDVMLNETEFRQLFLNLVRNGLEAMPANKKLTIKTFCKDRSVILSIQDEGEGISPEIKDKLGTPFLTTKAEGTGLGLAICHSIAARHKAKISYDTSSNGTTVNVTFKMISQKFRSASV